MRPHQLLVAIFIIASPVLLSCSGKDKKNTTSGSGQSVSEANAVPAIDISSLKDEPSILDAMQKVVDARLADEKKQKENADYAGHYLELTKLYTEVISASTAYSRTINDPARAVEFGNKLTAIQDKMYAK